MPATLTLKNIPDAVYERLKATALAHRRSMNSEAIVCLEAALFSASTTVSDRLARARNLRESLGQQQFMAAHIDSAKQEGRAQ